MDTNNKVATTNKVAKQAARPPSKASLSADDEDLPPLLPPEPPVLLELSPPAGLPAPPAPQPILKNDKGILWPRFAVCMECHWLPTGY